MPRIILRAMEHNRHSPGSTQSCRDVVSYIVKVEECTLPEFLECPRVPTKRREDI